MREECKSRDFVMKFADPHASVNEAVLSLSMRCKASYVFSPLSPEVELVMRAAGRLYTSHGGSAMRVCASHGAINLGKVLGDLDVARVFPSQLYTFSMMDMQEMGSFRSIKQFVATVLFPTLLSYTWMENVILGGCGLGSTFASHAAFELEACMSGIRAVFAFDPRKVPPVCGFLDSGNFSSISRESRVGFSALALVNLHFMEVPHFRFPAPALHFTCPLMQHENSFADGCAIESRCQLYNVESGVHVLPNSTHMTIGSDHYWDIARRLREDVSQRVALYDEIVNIKQANALEEQRLLFGGRQLEDGSSPACMMKADPRELHHIVVAKFARSPHVDCNTERLRAGYC